MISELYSKLKDLNIAIQVVGDRLDLQAPKGVLTKDLLNEIKSNKEDLIKLHLAYRKRRKKNTVINKIAENTSYALSSSQQRLWILSQLQGAERAYNMLSVFTLEGDFNQTAFDAAFQALVERHEILRTVFKTDENGEPRQFVLSSQQLGFKIIYDKNQSENTTKNVLDNKIDRAFGTVFNLEHGPLMKAICFCLEQKKYVFTFVIHHILSDEWSMMVMMKELIYLYDACLTDSPIALPPLRIQYKDYAAWQQNQLNGETLQEHKKYWMEQMKGELPVLDLPADSPRPPVQTFKGNTVRKTIPKALRDNLHKTCRENGATLFMGLLAALNTLLYKYTHQSDFIIGTPIAGRDMADLENQLGFYINTLALRVKLNPSDNFSAVLNKVKEVTQNAFEHQVYPFDKLLDDLELKRDPSRNPLFDVMIALKHNDNEIQETTPSSSGLQFKPYSGNEQTISKFDLSFDFSDSGKELSLTLEFNTDIYSTENIDQLSSHFCQILEKLIEEPSQSIQYLKYLFDHEIKELLRFSNGPKINYEFQLPVYRLFEEQVNKSPEAEALIVHNRTFSYAQINETANQLAHYLIEQPIIKPNALIAVYLQRSEWVIIAMLAVLKTGAAYLNIDPEYPEERIKFMLRDSQCLVCINDDLIGKLKENLGMLSKNNLSYTAKPNDLAYVIYTSGSTGKPKGVMIEHHSLFDYVQTFSSTFQLNAKDRCIQQASFSFDTHIEEVFPVLLNGGTILMASQGGADVGGLINLIEQKGASILSATPMVIKELNQCKPCLDSLRLLISGGDVFNAAMADYFIGKTMVYDSYGPSEATVCSTYHKIENLNINAVIGTPIVNRSIYLLDDQNNFVPPGAIGEICIGGEGVARGYLNRPELTSEKFINNPFNPSERLYKTGDLGRFLINGKIKFCGRRDEQVKINGYRIELGEIENALQNYHQIDTAIVVSSKNSFGNFELRAYYTAKQFLQVQQIKNHLAACLPIYMLPAFLIQLPVLPKLPNGKIDKANLPEPEKMGMSVIKKYIPPRNQTESNILAIWKEVLQQDKLGVTDNFFEAGGNSIKAFKVLAKMNQILNFKTKIQDLYNYPSIQELTGKPVQSKNLINLSKFNTNAKTALYFVPPIVGNSIVYKPLSMLLNENINSFGFQYQGLETDEAFFTSIEQAAEKFTDELIQQHRPNDSIVVVAYSMGASIAFEMIKLLEIKLNRTDFKLFLIDALVRNNFPETDMTPNENNEDYVSWMLEEFKKSVDVAVDENRISKFLHNNLKIHNNYLQQGKVNCSMHLFESKGSDLPTVMLNWKACTSKEVEHTYIEGGHWDALNDKNIITIKNAIEQATLFNQSIQLNHN